MGLVNLSVTPDEGETYYVEATGKDILIFERTNKSKRLLADVVEKASMEDLYRLAWITSKRVGLTDKTVTLDEFEKTNDVFFGKAEEEPDPTQPAPSTES